METISLQGKMNFFDKQVREYFKSGVGVDARISPLLLMPAFEIMKTKKNICHIGLSIGRYEFMVFV
jgi:hypothetical protein